MSYEEWRQTAIYREGLEFEAPWTTKPMLEKVYDPFNPEYGAFGLEEQEFEYNDGWGILPWEEGYEGVHPNPNHPIFKDYIQPDEYAA
jgi:hypothetical protein